MIRERRTTANRPSACSEAAAKLPISEPKSVSAPESDRLELRVLVDVAVDEMADDEGGANQGDACGQAPCHEEDCQRRGKHALLAIGVLFGARTGNKTERSVTKARLDVL